MQIGELVQNWPCRWIKGDRFDHFSSIHIHSNEVKRNGLFIAIKGKKDDGHDYVERAIKNGATCIVVEYYKEEWNDFPLTFVEVPNTKLFFSYASAAFYRFPSEKLHVIGVTGTNGKTTTAFFIYQLLTLANQKCAYIGTAGMYVNGEKIEQYHSSLTTWTPLHLHEALRYCVDDGVQYVTLEASSMGLEERRLDHCQIDLGVCLNMGNDHIEEHGTFENYQKAKRHLITLSKRMIFNRDDLYWNKIGTECSKTAGWFSLNDLQVMGSSLKGEILTYQHSILQQIVPFFGEAMRANLAAALKTCAVLLSTNYFFFSHAHQLQLPKGRMEIIEYEKKFVVIDYAHTPEALEKTLNELAKIASERLFIVFGCGGDRDKSKRKMMGEIAATYTQKMWITTDNPRDEDPMEICKQIQGELPSSSHVQIVLDRKEAILQALDEMEDQDIVLIAGKGDETYVFKQNEKIPFSDVDTILDYIQALEECGTTKNDPVA